MSGLPDPQPGYRWVIQTPPEPPRKRRIWPWIVGILLVVGIVIVGWIAAESLARSVTEQTIRDQVVGQLGLPADQEVDVSVVGAVLPQLIAGSLDEIHIASEDVVLDSFAGDVSVVAEDVPIRGGEASGGTAVVSIDEEQLRTLMSTVDGFPAESLGLDDPNVTMSTELQLLGLSFPIGVALEPGATEGDLTLTPSEFQLGSAQISADSLRDRFGGIADVVLQTWSVCVAQYLPAGVLLTGVEVDGSSTIATFEIDGGIVNDTALQANGTCS